jgi:CBS domain-containing protein
MDDRRPRDEQRPAAEVRAIGDSAQRQRAAMTEAAGQSMQAGAQAARGAGQAARDTGTRVAGQADEVVRQLAEAAAVYQGVARRLAEELRALVRAPVAATGGAQEFSRAWAEWLQGVFATNARFSRQALLARSLPEVAQIHARFVEDSLAALRESGVRLLEAAGELAERAIDPLQQGGGGGGSVDGGAVTIADVMSRDACLTGPDETVQEAAAAMARADLGALPVGEGDRIVGMLTDRDVAVRVAAAGKDPAKAKVREAMTPGVEHCFEDEEVGALAERMAALKVRRLPVLDRDKRLVGVVSLGDLAAGQADAALAGRALGGIARAGGPHRQRPVRPRQGGGGGKAAAARQHRQQRRAR